METKTRAQKGGEYGMNNEWYNGGEFLPSTTLPKGVYQKRQAEKKANRQDYATEQQRKTAIAMEMYKNDPRLTVPTTHEYYYAHAIELAKKDGKWEAI